jgi:DNA mismatch repair ATPase MutS
MQSAFEGLASISTKYEAILASAKMHWDLFLDSVSPKRKLLRKFRERWAAVGDKENFLAGRYFDLTHLAWPDTWVDDKTWRDLELEEIFRRMDTTVTPVGSQVLFAQLRKYVKDPEVLARRYAIYKHVADYSVLREELQLQLSKLSDDDNADLADILFGAGMEMSPNRQFILAWSLVSLVVLLSLLFFKLAAWAWLAVAFVNVFLIFREAFREHKESGVMRHVGALLNVADELAKLHEFYPSLPQLKRLKDEAAQRTTIRKTLFWFSFSRTHPFSILFSILNFAFLIELIINTRTMERFFRIRSRLTETYELVGEIDAIVAIASYLQLHPQHCLPTLVNTRILSIVEGVHPLLPGGVANSVRMEQRSALVTGSNMAGKTTFIKMLANNAILAQTVGFCLASAATIPRSTIMASIHGAHSVNAGKSHYFAEIETIDRFIRDRKQGGIQILAIDEPFNGTNTVERIAVARSVLESLGEHAIVLTTTHDVELQDLLSESYMLFHFQENPDVDGYFDYKLKPGPATARNAIKLLKKIGFPEEIVANAMSYAE